MRKQQANVNKTPQQMMQDKYRAARYNLLLMLILTVVNIVLLFTETNTMFLFSATLPYYAIGLGWYWGSIFLLAIGAVALVGFFLSWFLSKDNHKWMIVALVLFVIDTAAMLWIYAVLLADFSSGILDIVMHALVFYYLILGVINGKKLNELPQEIVSDETYQPVSETMPEPVVATLNGEDIEE